MITQDESVQPVSAPKPSIHIVNRLKAEGVQQAFLLGLTFGFIILMTAIRTYFFPIPEIDSAVGASMEVTDNEMMVMRIGFAAYVLMVFCFYVYHKGFSVGRSLYGLRIITLKAGESAPAGMLAARAILKFVTVYGLFGVGLAPMLFKIRPLHDLLLGLTVTQNQSIELPQLSANDALPIDKLANLHK